MWKWGSIKCIEWNCVFFLCLRSLNCCPRYIEMHTHANPFPPFQLSRWLEEFVSSNIWQHLMILGSSSPNASICAFSVFSLLVASWGNSSLNTSIFWILHCDTWDIRLYRKYHVNCIKNPHIIEFKVYSSYSGGTWNYCQSMVKEFNIVQHHNKVVRCSLAHWPVDSVEPEQCSKAAPRTPRLLFKYPIQGMI